MTDTKRTRNTSELTVSAAVEKLNAIDAEQRDAQIELLDRFSKKRVAVMLRVHPAARAAVESEREKARQENEAEPDDVQAASTIEPDAVPDRLLTPLSAERLAVGKR